MGLGHLPAPADDPACRRGGLTGRRTTDSANLERGAPICIGATKAEMKKVLAEIQDGTFAKNWMDEYHGGL
ncbi:hypothetical protein ACWEQI_16040, partial [Streptomyces coelicoflavus]